MNIRNNIESFTQSLPQHCKLIAVSKTQPEEKIKEAYQAGQRDFGENKAQELAAKYEALPKRSEERLHSFPTRRSSDLDRKSVV